MVTATRMKFNEKGANLLSKWLIYQGCKAWEACNTISHSEIFESNSDREGNYIPTISPGECPEVRAGQKGLDAGGRQARRARYAVGAPPGKNALPA